jgi:ketosteroid isomerase-like protein
MRPMRCFIVTSWWLLAAGCCPATPAVQAPITPTPVVTPAVANPELSPALAPLAWIVGDWQGDDGTEHWIAVDGAIYGIGLQRTGMFEALVIDDGEGSGPADGVLRLIAMPGGGSSVEFRASQLTVRSARFANPAHDAPKQITYERTPEGLRATLDADSNRQITFAFRPGTRVTAPELEAADRAFAADTAARGVDGWTAAFAPDGGMLRKGQRVSGAAIAETMRPVLTSGSLAWAPVASGVAGTLGFTVGKATFTGATPAERWRSTYVTIWRRQPDGTWKVLFDTGRAVNAP